MNRRPFPFAFLATAILLAASLVLHIFPGAYDPILNYAGIGDVLLLPDTNTETEDIAQLTAQLDALEAENRFLRRDQLVAGDTAYPKILARILYADPDPARSALRIALPEGHTIAEGAPVVAPGNILIGVIERVGSRSADVLLLDDPASKIAAQINEIDGLLQGSGQGQLTMQFVPASDIPRKGDVITATDGADGIPEGLFIGTVTTVVSDPGNPFVEINAVSGIILQNLEAVAVLLGSEAEL